MKLKFPSLANKDKISEFRNSEILFSLKIPRYKKLAITLQFWLVFFYFFFFSIITKYIH